MRARAHSLPLDEARFMRDLDRVESALAAHLRRALMRFGQGALSVIDLPPLSTGGAIVAEQVGTAATLFWCSQVERAGLPEFVDALAEGLVHGTVNLPLTSGGDRLMQYFRAREQRFSAGEREALYRHLFGAAGEHDGFAALFDDYVARLSGIGRLEHDDSLARLAAGVNVVARELASHLSERGVGMAAFAAREIVDTIRTTLSILRDPDLAAAFGGGGPWQIIAANAAAVLGRSVDPSAYLARASAGYTLLKWLADHADALDAGVSARIDPMSDVVRAALSWQASTGET